MVSALALAIDPALAIACVAVALAPALAPRLGPQVRIFGNGQLVWGKSLLQLQSVHRMEPSRRKTWLGAPRWRLVGDSFDLTLPAVPDYLALTRTLLEHVPTESWPMMPYAPGRALHSGEIDMRPGPLGVGLGLRGLVQCLFALVIAALLLAKLPLAAILLAILVWQAGNDAWLLYRLRVQRLRVDEAGIAGKTTQGDFEIPWSELRFAIAFEPVTPLWVAHGPHLLLVGASSGAHLVSDRDLPEDLLRWLSERKPSASVHS